MSSKTKVSLPVEQATIVEGGVEGFFNELVKHYVEKGEIKFAIGCPDEQMHYLHALMEYANNQNGWSAQIDEDNILKIEKI